MGLGSVWRFGRGIVVSKEGIRVSVATPVDEYHGTPRTSSENGVVVVVAVVVLLVVVVAVVVLTRR
jgi:hypothetical protein